MLLTLLTIPFLLIFLLLQSVLVLINSDSFKVSEHIQESEIQLTLESLVKKEETNPLSFAALANPMLSPMFFVWPKDVKYLAMFEGRVAVSISKQQHETLQVTEKYKLAKKTTRAYYRRRWFEKPLLLNWMLPENEKMKAEYSEEHVRYKLV